MRPFSQPPAVALYHLIATKRCTHLNNARQSAAGPPPGSEPAFFPPLTLVRKPFHEIDHFVWFVASICRTSRVVCACGNGENADSKTVFSS